MNIKLALMSAFLAFSPQAIAAEQNNPNMVYPYIVLIGCSIVPPNGYVVTGVYPGNSTNNCGGSGIGGYVAYLRYESYFDKPVGATIAMCPGQYPIPDGWYQVGAVPTSGCFFGQTQAIVIERYS